jgi:energy-coupling factor transporter transmembrane protein EcfT
MNAIRQTEFRTLSDRQAQARLERMLANRRAAERAREARLLRSPNKRNTAKPEPFTWIDSAVFLAPMGIVAVLILLARWSGVLS